MSTARNDGGPAFPQFSPQEVGLESDGLPKLEYAYSEGMTLRDYFAIKALQGMLAAIPDKTDVDPLYMSAAAYVWADKMLKVRSK